VTDPEGTGPEVPPTGGPGGVTEFPALAAAAAKADSVSVDWDVRI
jgi:hypothetical protein